MRSNDGDDEKPHTVYLDACWIDQTEVTNAMFAQFVQEAGCRSDAEKQGSGYVFNPSTKDWEETKGADWQHPRGPSSSLEGLAEHPAVQVRQHISPPRRILPAYLQL